MAFPEGKCYTDSIFTVKVRIDLVDGTGAQQLWQDVGTYFVRAKTNIPVYSEHFKRKFSEVVD